MVAASAERTLRTLNALADIARQLQANAKRGVFHGGAKSTDSAYLQSCTHVSAPFRCVVILGIDAKGPAGISPGRVVHFAHRKADRAILAKAAELYRARGLSGLPAQVSEPNAEQVRHWLLCIFGSNVPNLWVRSLPSGETHVLQPLAETKPNHWEATALTESDAGKLRLAGYATFAEVFGALV